MKKLISEKPVFVSGLILLVAYGLMVAWRIRTGIGFDGSESYSRIAADVLNTGEFNTSFRPPLYPLVLASLMAIFHGAWENAAMIAQGIAGTALGMLLVSAAVRINGGAAAGFITLVLYLANILFQFEVMAKRETVLFTICLIVFFMAFLNIQNLNRRYLAMAVSAALALLLRPNAVVLLPIGLIFAFFDRKRPDFSLAVLAFPTAAFLAILLPWQMFVYQHTGEFPITTSTNSGQTLWKGNNPYLFSVYPKADIDVIEGELSREIGGKDITIASSDAEMKALAKKFIKENPGLTAKNAMIKAALFFSPVPLPLGKGEVVIENGTARLEGFRYRNSLILGFATLQSLIVWMGWIGFLATSRSSSNRQTLALVSVVFTLLLLAVHTLTYPEGRYRWPLDIFLTILAADYLASRIRSATGAPIR